MTFHGLFIGVDRYQDGRVSWLAGAARDATALHALFADSLADRSARLLTDEAATPGVIRDELQRLAAEASENDIVVVAYAGQVSRIAAYRWLRYL